VNTAGQVVGGLGPPPDAVGQDLEVTTPFLLSQGVWTVFNTRQPESEARAINPDGIIVGGDMDHHSETATEDAWVRQTDGTVQYLPELSVGHSGALGINKYGAIVGYSQTAGGVIHAVLWRPQ
jgi:probable HAF family extracellular repeat protein